MLKMSTLFHRNRLAVFERVTKNSVYMTSMLYSIKHQFWSIKDQFNGNTEKRRPPPHLTGHEVYEMVKDVHIVLGKRKKTNKKTEEDDMWKKQSIF
jgi:hypothetical protein